MDSELSIIMVPTTKCNLACRHCFEVHTDRVMRPAELREVMRKICEYGRQQGIRGITFYWQGGEVMTLGMEWFDKMEHIVSQQFAGSQINIQHKLQTNLIPYSEKWKPLMERLFHNSIGSSLDYPSHYRGFKGDGFNDLWRKYLSRARADGIEVGVISVLNEATLKESPTDFLDYYSHRMGITNLQLNFPFEPGEGNGAEESFFLEPSDLGRFLIDLFDAWIDETKGWYRKIRINPFCELIDAFSLAPRPSRLNCIWSGNCADTFFSIGPDGSVGLCDCWVTSLPEFTFGNLQTQSMAEIANSAIRKRMQKRIEHVLGSDCADCPFLGICFGGCIIRTYGKYGVVEHKDPYCPAYYALFSRVQAYTRSFENQGGVQ
jgi:uncharacterized protein